MIKKQLLGFALAMLAFGLVARADDSNNGHDGDSEGFEQVTLLLPTLNTATNATGAVKMETEFEHGTNQTEVKVSVLGLAVGLYNVTVTDTTGTNVFDLGTINVINKLSKFEGWEHDEFASHFPTNLPIVLTNLPDVLTNLTCLLTNFPPKLTNSVNFGRAEFVLPLEVDPTNVAYLFIYDTNGVVNLTGDFLNLTNISALVYNKTVDVIPCSATNAQGSGTLTLAYKKGKTSSSFKLNATGLPAKQTLTLQADGVKSTSTSTGSKGTVKVQNLPKVNLANLQIVEAKDKVGKVVFRLEF
jgi:hypothetical protein